jgi:hypothetical protein
MAVQSAMAVSVLNMLQHEPSCIFAHLRSSLASLDPVRCWHLVAALASILATQHTGFWQDIACRCLVGYLAFDTTIMLRYSDTSDHGIQTMMCVL